MIDDTPDDSDGAAVAAATACFLADIPCRRGRREERLSFLPSSSWARRKAPQWGRNQQQFELWIERLELNDPDKFLVRLRNVVDVLVQDQWWFDRDALQAQIRQLKPPRVSKYK